jgi:excisionase family DNA binding protein
LVELLTTDQVAQIIDNTRQYVQAEIRKGSLKAKRYGKYYKVTREDLNAYMGISNNKEEFERDLYIAKLEAKVKHYEFIINTFKGSINNLEQVLNQA